MTEITRDELKQKLDRGDSFRLVETLPADQFREQHLPRAVNLPPDEIEQRASEALPDKNAEIIVYCGSSSCDASEKAAEALRAMGYSNVRRYVGGKKDWTDAGLPVEGEQHTAGARSL